MTRRQPTAEERANAAIRASIGMPRDVAADHLRYVASTLDAEGEHEACARCHEEIRRRTRCNPGGPL